MTKSTLSDAAPREARDQPVPQPRTHCAFTRWKERDAADPPRRRPVDHYMLSLGQRLAGSGVSRISEL